ncbi:hypothetical protein BTO04_00140 [Polaribacter sp. SA4-10]|uniref:hypothetical protein n=1 Tax=Polaribacter sp. SA4-10 TaxID=754397 RepID=UPI000B3C58C0|nr:hypothetical protein [Polaribacter sp. SA4-10]ARV05198.1 hypothetical protein BTO04_00140 [Polaribacter sp. SA4-10]
MSKIKILSLQYKGWKNTIEISNLDIKILVVPEIGRIIYYGFTTGENIFYENQELEGTIFNTGAYFKKDHKIQAPNVGGNRVLPCSEEYFNTITGSRHVPDPYINASPYKVSYLKNGVILESPISKILGIQIKRTITISETGTAVKIEQELTKIKSAKNTALEKIPLTIWSLSKIKTPNISYLPIDKKSIFNNGYLIPVWPDAKNYAAINVTVKNSILELKSTDNSPQKVGSDSKKWVAGYLEESLFIEEFNFETIYKNSYPDKGTSVTIFGNDLFTELECLSPEKTLKIGEKINYDLNWSLHKVANKNEAFKILRSL